MFNKMLSLFKNVSSGAGEETDIRLLPRDKKNKKIKEIFSNIPTMETDRLLLRRIKENDYPDMFEYSSDENVTKYLTWFPHKTIYETEDYTRFLQKRYAEGKFYDWGIEYKENKKFIGTCGFTSINIYQNKAEVGYVLAKPYWGQGIIPEALRAVMDFGFYYIGFDLIEARFIDGNTRSCAVMKKMGMEFDTINFESLHVKGEYKTVQTYKITREKYFDIKKGE